MQCPACAAANADEATTCTACGQKLSRPRRRRKMAEEAAPLPGADGRTPLELIAYRCAVIGLIPFVGLLMGPAAILLGLLAYRRARATSTAGTPIHVRAALILGSLVLFTNWAGFALLLLGLASASR